MKRVLITTLLLAGIGLFGVRPAAAISINLVDAGTSGSFWNVDIVVSDLAGEIVSAFDVDVFYDTSMVVENITFGSDLGLVSSDPFDWVADAWGDHDSSIAGYIDIFEVSWLSDAILAGMQGDSVMLATLTFDTSGGGGGLADLELVLDLASGNDVKGLNNQVILPTTVTVPEPASVLLMGLGLVGLWASRRRSSVAAV